MLPEDGINVIEAIVPLAEIQKYAMNLKSITQGKGTYSMDSAITRKRPRW